MLSLRNTHYATQYALSDMRKLFASILCLLAVQTVRIPFSQISPQSLF